MKSNTKHILYLAIGFWVITTAVVFYFFWPLISQEISYFFGKKNNDAPQERVVEETKGDVRVQYDVPNKIVIPKIGVDAPIIEAISVEEADIIKALESGVGHYPNTALPGEVGNIFLTGHSSNYSWAKGSYNFVFSILNKMSVGDKIYIYYDKYLYTYDVFEVTLVSPKDTSVLNQGSDSIVSVMTCDPPGTTWKRRIVKARQVDPSPESNKKNEFKLVVPQELVGN
ncbi:sortase [bacterium]|nr:sortase [bacterium]